MEIPLSGKRGSGYTALLDPDMYQILCNYKWHLTSGGYASSSELGMMHRTIMNLHDSELVVDHLNGNRLDNRRINLKIKTQKGNAKNKTNDPKEFGFTGVAKPEANGLYETVHKGFSFYSHENPEMCALCYDSIVTYCYGPGKRVNDTKLPPMDISYWKLSEESMWQLEQWKERHTDFIGVKKSRDGWKAKIVVDLGEFETPEEAARAYDKALRTVKPHAKKWEFNYSK
jgi:hypothetical protein